ncbi:MAG: hypothetical protein ACC707_19690 [Thiohalomonadales bacterium]
MVKKAFYIFLLFVLIACGDIVGNKITLNERYFIEAIDDDKNRSLYYSLKGGGGIGRVNNGVIAVGLNDTHIIIKQRYENADRYYILDMTKDRGIAEPDDSVYGPYNIDQFADARNDLNVEDALTFSRTF